jgi:hypothetical protein
MPALNLNVPTPPRVSAICGAAVSVRTFDALEPFGCR